MMAKSRVVFFALVAASCTIGCRARKYEVPKSPDIGKAMMVRKAFAGESTASAGGGSTAAVAQPTGWATLKGRFVLDGAAPQQSRLKVSSDMEVCAPGGNAPLSEDVVVGSGGGIQGVAIFLTSKISDDEPWTHPSAKAGQGGEVVFDQKECRFLTHVIGLRAGQTMKILNSDPVGHNTNIQAKKNASFNQIVAANGSVNYTPTEVENGPVPVSCSIHPWMSAYMLVRGNGYFAVTDEDGNFEIPNLPAGVELEFKVWQEKSKFMSGIEIGGSPVKKGKYNVTLEPDATKEVAVNIPVSLFN